MGIKEKLRDSWDVWRRKIDQAFDPEHSLTAGEVDIVKTAINTNGIGIAPERTIQLKPSFYAGSPYGDYRNKLRIDGEFEITGITVTYNGLQKAMEKKHGEVSDYFECELRGLVFYTVGTTSGLVGVENATSSVHSTWNVTYLQKDFINYPALITYESTGSAEQGTAYAVRVNDDMLLYDGSTIDLSNLGGGGGDDAGFIDAREVRTTNVSTLEVGDGAVSVMDETNIPELATVPSTNPKKLETIALRMIFDGTLTHDIVLKSAILEPPINGVLIYYGGIYSSMVFPASSVTAKNEKLFAVTATFGYESSTRHWKLYCIVKRIA